MSKNNGTGANAAENENFDGLQQTKLKNLNSFNAGVGFSVHAVSMIVITLLVSVIILVAKIDTESNVFKYLNYLVSPIAIFICLLSVIKVRKIALKPLFPVKTHPKYYILALLLIFGLLFSVSYVNEGFLFVLKKCGYVPKQSYLPELEGALIIPALFVIAVLPAVFEEALFRGLILNCALRQMGTVRAVLTVGFCFSIAHGSPEQTFYQFICGCAFALLAVRSQSILPCVLIHFLNNALIVILSACHVMTPEGALLIPFGFKILVSVLSALSFIGATLWLILDKKPVLKCEKGGVKLFYIAAALGIIVFAVIWISSLFIH